MLGRAAYHNPYLLAEAEEYCFGAEAPTRTRAEIVEALVPYAREQVASGVSLRAIAQHVLGLYHGRSGVRAWRRMLSDAALLATAGPELFITPLREVEPAAVAEAVS